MEDVFDDEDDLPANVAPLNPSRLLERSDGSDDEDPPALIEVEDSDDEKEGEVESTKVTQYINKDK